MKKVYSIVIIAICCLPLVLLPFWGETSSAEKRDLAEFPSLFVDGKLNTSFSQGLENWIADHFSFRSELITANNQLKATLFSSSDEEQVIVGKNDWLYFAETVPDFLGQNRMLPQDIENLAVTLELMQEYITSRGAQMVFTVAPNKNTVYPENMPYNYRQTTDPTNLELLTQALADQAYYVDLRPLLSEEQEQTYHARDSHWNNLGARCGAQAILERAGKALPAFAQSPWEWQQIWAGDLDAMIFPTLGYKDWQAVFSMEPTFRYTSNYHGEEDLLITTEKADAQGSLLVFRDSFANALLPFLAESYHEAKFSRAMPYGLYELETTSYDTVVVEIAERNLSSLLLQAPVMPAPSRQPDTASLVSQTSAVMETREAHGFLHYYGYLPDTADSGTVYLRLSNGEITEYVEAFPIYESELLEQEGLGRNGFSAYVPAEKYEGYTVSVVTGR